MNGHKTTAQLLLKRGATIDARDKYLQSALHIAAQNRECEAVVRLLLKRANIEAKDWKGLTALHLAASSRGCETIVNLLLRKGAKIEARTKDCLTPLHIAAGGRGCEAIVKLLLMKGADINAKDNNRKTPLLWATEKKHEATRQLLHQHGARGDRHGTALQRALLLFCCCGLDRMSMSV
jgi:ankyrin repeat protein